MRRIQILSLLLGFVFFAACSEEEKADEIINTTNSVGISYDPTPYTVNIKNFTNPFFIPPDNQLRAATVRLGRMLFYEKKLSDNNTQSCASCHLQQFAFTDTARFSIGIRGQRGHRQAMSVFNLGFNRMHFFWDGRAMLLRDQALMPIQDSLEMDEDLADVIQKLKADPIYTAQFTRAFGSDSITEERMGLAMEQFMLSIVSVDSKYDRYRRGEDTLTAQEERGRFLFFQEFNPGVPSMSGADCVHCHTVDNFTNNRFSNNGLDSDADMTDIGRQAVTNNAMDKGRFRTTSLRNIELTAPYMHDGRFKTLEEVVEHYNSGMKSSSTIDPALIYPLNSGGLQLSTSDKAALVAFLKTLTDNELINNPAYSNPF